MNKRKFFIVLVIGALAFSLSLSLARECFATNSCGGVDTVILQCEDDHKGGGICHVLDLIRDILIIGVGILGVIGITIVGVQYLTAGGNEEKVRKAKRRMFHIVIGLALYVVMAALANFLSPGGTFCSGGTSSGTSSSSSSGSSTPAAPSGSGSSETPTTESSDSRSRDASEVIY